MIDMKIFERFLSDKFYGVFKDLQFKTRCLNASDAHRVKWFKGLNQLNNFEKNKFFVRSRFEMIHSSLKFAPRSPTKVIRYSKYLSGIVAMRDILNLPINFAG
jgi:hypothetical protein